MRILKISLTPKLLIQSTALLFFTKTAASEAAEKSFVFSRNNKTNHKIASLLIHSTRKTALNSGLPVIEINSLQQIGNSFGERISNAVASVFENGFENVIIIGNDCPQLTTTIIKNAAAQLSTHGLVAGPDGRGGAYLIGINKDFFSKSIFKELAWKTNSLFSDLCQSTGSQKAYFILPALKDVNNLADIISIKNDLAALHTIRLFLTSLLTSFFRRTSVVVPGVDSFISSLFGLRAPPLF